MKTKIKIAITDDHPLMIEGIKTALSDTPEVEIFGEALNGKQLLLMLKTKQPDIVLLDIRMPELDGLDTLEIIQSKYPETKVIMLSQYSERRMIKKSIEFGAKGYLLKDCGKHNLIKAILKVALGGTCFEIYAYNYQIEIKTNGSCQLSSREKEVLQLICKELTNNEIAGKLNISKITVDTHRARMMQKAGVKNVIGLYKWALENRLIKLDLL